MIHCRINYTESAILLEFYPGTANFDYWLHKKVDADRWKQTGNGIWLGCEITEEEAIYIEKTANAQWGTEGCEVIGRSVVFANPLPEPAKIIEEPRINENVQLSLF